MNRIKKALYWPAPEDEQILRIRDTAPCRAEVVELRGKRADLRVTDCFGRTFSRLNVAVGRCSEPDCCIIG